MPWVEVFAALVMAHLVGDYLLQTDSQATYKHNGLAPGATLARRALLSHVATYTLAFVPVLVWLGESLITSLGWVVLIAVPHAIQDDGRLIVGYMRTVKGITRESAAFRTVAGAVDQTFHLITLFAIALLAGR